jgi:hypothetical protein
MLIISLGPPTLPPRRSPSERIIPHSRVFEILPALLERNAKSPPTSDVFRHLLTALNSDSLRESSPRLNNAPMRRNLGTYHNTATARSASLFAHRPVLNQVLSVHNAQQSDREVPMLQLSQNGIILRT